MATELGSERQKQAISEISHAFDEKFAKPIVGGLYKFAMLLVAIAMVLLPTIYIGIICSVGYGLYYHVVNNTVVFETMRGKAALVVFFGPLVVGGVLVFFMLKPLFAGGPPEPKLHKLQKNEQPLLFAFVEAICKAVGAPVPNEVCVDCDVNASAGFSHGIRSMFTNDLTLIIGLPLVTNLTPRQFAGVLAHEFGHFSQGAGMRLTYIIRTINAWFSRVVYERDKWDEKIYRASKSGHWMNIIVFLAARLFLWITRKILWVLMTLGHTISCNMLRQMEYDADLYEIQLAGSRAFEQTAKKLPMLMAAMNKTFSDLSDSWKEKKLADDFHQLLSVNLRRMPADLATDIEKEIESQTTGIFDTHPSDKDRIARARSANFEGIFRPCPSLAVEGTSDGEPTTAEVLFADLERLSKSLSLNLYREQLQCEIEPHSLISAKILIVAQERDEAGYAALVRVFQGTHSAMRPVPLPAELPDASADADADTAQLKTLRADFVREAAGQKEAIKKFDEADQRYDRLLVLKDLADSGVFAIDKSKCDLESVEPSDIAKEAERVGEVRAEIGRTLARLTELNSRRIQTAVALYRTGDFSKDQADFLDVDLSELWRSASRFTDHLEQIDKVLRAFGNLAGAVDYLKGNEENKGVINAIRSKMGIADNELIDLSKNLKSSPYPFSHAKEGSTLAGVVVSKLPDPDNLGMILDCTKNAVNRSYKFYARVMARFALIIESVETLVGMEPLPKPEDEDAHKESAA